MRREDRPKVPVTTTSDEFVDILQVQQLLINERTREGTPHATQTFQPPTTRAPETFGYYYGGYQQPQNSASVDDLVAMWFAGPSGTGRDTFFFYNFICLIHIHVHCVYNTTNICPPANFVTSGCDKTEQRL